MSFQALVTAPRVESEEIIRIPPEIGPPPNVFQSTPAVTRALK